MEKLITIDGVQYRCTPVEEQQEEKKISGYYIAADATIYHVNNIPDEPKSDYIFATEKQARSAIAMARISQIMQNDERFGGAVTNEEWENIDVEKWTIQRMKSAIFVDEDDIYCFLAFHTEEQAKLFLQENEELVRKYYMLD